MDTKKWTRLVALVALLAAVPAGAQERSDFTGTWARVDRTPSAGSSHVERIVQGRDHLIVQTESHGSAGSLGYGAWGERGYTIGGPLESKKDAAGRLRSSAVSWDGPRLVFITITTEGENTRVERETWSLRDDGLFLDRDRCTTDWQGTTNHQLVFRRTEDRPALAVRPGRPRSPLP